MPPNSEDVRSVVPSEKLEPLKAPQAAPRKYELIYANLLVFGYGHIAALYGLYLCCTSAKWGTVFLIPALFVLGGLGITAGVHRLWTHKAYKAKLPLEIILIVLYSIAYQNTAIHWIREHRMHHKHSDTDADPHNATRGLFYSHIGWLLVRKHDEVKKRGKYLDMSDVYSNPVLRFQKKYAIPFVGLICFVLPVVIPMYFWGESFNIAWHAALLRYVASLHLAFIINSAGHKYGVKPYDKNIKPTENLIISALTQGEGFHNYHHCFPWDYRTAELSNNYLNWTTHFIDLFAKIGWAYDLKTASQDVVEKRAVRTGDGNLWGWGDEDMTREDIDGAKVLYANKSGPS